VNTRRALFKKLMERCKRFKICPFCGASQGARAAAATGAFARNCADAQCASQAS
jgi:hypothetical protein